MRIDLNSNSQAAFETAFQPGSVSAPNSFSTSSSLGEDQARLSSATLQAGAQVEALAAQVSQLPEIRDQRVQSLQQAIQAGTFQVQPQPVAGALFEHMIAWAAA